MSNLAEEGGLAWATKLSSKDAMGSLSSADTFDIAFMSTRHEKLSKLLLNVSNCPGKRAEE
eukprot:gene17749-12716_t